MSKKKGAMMSFYKTKNIFIVSILLFLLTSCTFLSLADDSSTAQVRIITYGYTVTISLESQENRPIENQEIRIGVPYPTSTDSTNAKNYVDIASGVYTIKASYHIYSENLDYTYTIDSITLDAGAKYLLKFKSENEFDTKEELTRAFTLIREE